MAEVPKSIKASLYIDGKPAEASLKNLKQVTQTLRRELDGLTVGTEAWNRKMEQLQLHAKNLQAIQNEVKGVGGAFGWLRTEIGKLGALAIGYLGFQFVTSQFQNIILANAKLSDSLADIRRTAGLTEKEVRSLNTSLSGLDTRTSTAGLRDIAVTAGKLGVAKGDILSFVEATDKLVVTLGDELGDADQITTQLGKILNVFDGHVTGDNITHLGNAMVVMANAGVASGGFISEFAQRVSGIAKTANLSLGATIGLAAGLEELGGKSESASTAVTRLLSDIASDLPKAARIAKTPLEEFQKLFAETPEKALIKYAVGLTQNKQAFSDVATSFKDAGEEGSRVVATLSAIGTKSEFMQGKIDLANKSLLETNAINEGFALKNEDFGASVDKLGKKFSSLTANQALTGFLQSLVMLTSSLIDGFNNHALAFARLVKLIVIGAAAWATYRLYVAAANSTQLAFIVSMVRGESVMALSRTAGLALAAVKYTLAGNFTKAAQAVRLFNLALEANPIGIVIAVLAAAVTAIILFKDATTEAAIAQKTLDKIRSDAAEKISEEKDKIQALVLIINSQTEAYSDRIAAIKVLRGLLPDHLKGYTDEEILAGKAETAIKAYVKALEKKAEAESAQEELKKLKTEARDIKQNGDSLSFLQTAGLLIKNSISPSNYGVDATILGAKNQQDALHKNQLQQDAITDKFKADIKEQLLADGKTGGLAPDNAAGKTLDSLNAKLADLKKQKGAAIIGSKIYLDLVKQISALEKEIAKYDGSADKKGQKAGESEAKKRIKEFEALGKEQKALKVSLLQEQLSKNQKEIAQEEQKYKDLIDKEKFFLTEKGVTKKQTAATLQNISELEAQRDLALKNIMIRQEADMIQKIKDLRIGLGNLYETEYQKELNRVNQFYDQLEKDSAGNEEALAKIKIARQQDLASAEINEKKRLQEELDRIESSGNVVSADQDKKKLARINKKYDDEIDALKKKFSKEIQETQSFKDAIDAINKNRQGEIDQADDDKNRQIKEKVVEGAQLVSDTTFQIAANNRRKESDANLKKIENERDAELKTKGKTAADKDAINKKYDKRVRDEKLRAWKADQAAAQTQNVINTALAFTKALPNWVNAGFVVAAGIANGLVIASAEPPQYATGGFSDADPAGYVPTATIFKNSASGRPFMAGEAGKEWIAPAWMLQNPRTANLIGMLETVRREKRGFASGGFNDTGSGAAGTAFDMSHIAMQNELLVRQNEHLQDLAQSFDQFQRKPWQFPMRQFMEENQKLLDLDKRVGS
jgi:TP901 family phage tail tape measure protein